MEQAHMIGQRKRATVEQDEQGTVLLRSMEQNTSFPLSPDEALDLLQWLFEHQDELALQIPTGRLDHLQAHEHLE